MTQIATLNSTAPARTGYADSSSIIDAFLQYVDRPGRTAAQYKDNLKHFAAYLSFAGITAPTRADVIAYRDYLTTPGHVAIKPSSSTPFWEYQTDRHGNVIRRSLAVSTVTARLQTVKMFFAWTAATGIYPDIAKGIHAPKQERTHKKDAMDVNGIQALEAAVTARVEAKTAAADGTKDAAGKAARAAEQALRDTAMIKLTSTLGLRVIELQRADIGDFETIAGQAFLTVQGKGHAAKDTRKAIPAPVAGAIKAYLDARADNAAADAPLFRATGNRSAGRMTTQSIGRIIKSTMREAGYDSSRITPHSLRHTAASAAMTVTGDNIYQVRDYMRHASIDTTTIYLEAAKIEQDVKLSDAVYNHLHGTQQPVADITARLADMTPAQLDALKLILDAIK